MGMQFPGTFTGCWLLKFPFLSGSTRKSVLPLVSPLFAGFYPSRWACSASCFLQSCSDVQWTWIHSKILSTLCRQIVDLPQGLAEVARDHLGGLLSGLEELLGSGRAGLPVPYHPLTILAGMSSPARRKLFTWGILGRCEADGGFNAALITRSVFISKNTVSSEKWARWDICACSWTCEVEIRWEMVGRTWCSFWKRVVNWHKLHLLSAKPWGKKGFVFHFNTQINMWNTANPFLWWNFSSTAESLCKWDVGWDGIKVELGQASPPASRDIRWRRAELTCSCGIWFLSASEKPNSKKVLKYLRDLSADLLKQVWTYTEITPQMGLRWSFWLKFQPLSGP